MLLVYRQMAGFSTILICVCVRVHACVCACVHVHTHWCARVSDELGLTDISTHTQQSELQCRTSVQFQQLTKYSGTSVHERPRSLTIRFTNKFSRAKKVSDEERRLGSQTRKLATAAS
jgi:hypothetical protein